MGDVDERVGDEVDGHDVRRSEVGADEPAPCGKCGEPLDRGEQVIGTVDLVDLAGLGVTDDDRGPVDAPGHLRLGPDDPLGLELRAVIGRGKVLALVEHLLAEAARMLAGDGDRRDVVKAADTERVGELDDPSGAVDVDGVVDVLRRRHVVERPEVDEVIDLALQPFDVTFVEAEARFLEVTEQRRHHLMGMRAPAPDPRREPALRGGSDERVHLGSRARQQSFHDVSPQETGCTCHQVQSHVEQASHVCRSRAQGIL